MPRHGGTDPGASGNGIVEKDLNLLISKYMYNRLKELGYSVTLIRDSDETISPDERVDKILAAYGNNKDVIVISNHINAGGGDGAEVIYALRNTNKLSNLILEQLEEEGQNVRKAYQRRLPSDTSKDYYFIHRNTGVTEPVLIEYGFLDSTGDDVNQLKNDYERYAEAVVRAISEYTDSSYVPIEGSNVYVVKRGDTLWGIAKKYNIPVQELKAFNNLTSNSLSIGDILKIPSTTETTDYIVYIVSSGDNLYSIARKYNITVDELKSYNNLTSNILNIGQQLKIPTSITELPSEDYIEYVVKSGDSLYSIARKYDTTVSELMNYNNLTSNLLNIGKTIKIPSKEVTAYTVKSGDSLYSIARKYNTDVDTLKRKNNLTSNLLDIGQILIIE